jgi:hypothetical protein
MVWYTGLRLALVAAHLSLVFVRASGLVIVASVKPYRPNNGVTPKTVCSPHT